MAVSYSFQGKVILITGASSGIGRETAMHFASAGCEGLALVGRDKTRLKETANRCQENGSLEEENILLLNEDLSDTSTPKTIITSVINKFGKLDILVNNAAQACLSSLSDPELSDKYDSIYAVNVRSPLLLTQQAVPHLIKTKGNIITVSSICGKAAVPNMLAYNLSKAALDYSTQSMARYLAARQVRVNSVNPGSIMTPIHTRAGRDLNEVCELAKHIHPLGRIGESNEVAKTILFLASDHASFITGETISVDGGRFLICP